MNYKKAARWVILVLSVITLAQLYFISKLQFDYDFESYFPQDDPDIKFFLEFRDKFENDSDYLLLGIKSDSSIYRKVFLDKVVRLTTAIKQLDYVDKVISPTSLKVNIVSAMGGIQYPVLHRKSPEKLPSDSAYISQNPDMVGTLFSEDGKSLAIIIKHKNMINREESELLMSSLQDVLEKTDFEELHLAGRIKAEFAYVMKMKNELIIFVSTSILLIILFLYVSFKSWWGIIIPMIVVLLSVLWSLGMMGMAGNPINLMTVLMPTIMFVVGMSDVVHIISKYLEELRKGRDKISAIKTTFKEVGLATFLTSVTTAIGFLTLTTSGIKPIVSFGIYTALGVFLAFLLAFSLLPSILIFQKKPNVIDRKGKQLFWNSMLQRLFVWLLGHQKWVVAMFIVMTSLSILGITFIKVDAKIIDELSDDDPIKKDFLFFEELFSGVRPFELAVSLKDTSLSLLDYEVAQEMKEVESYVSEHFQIKHVISPLTIIKGINRATHSALPTYYRVPDDKKAFNRLVNKVQKFKKAKPIQIIISHSGHEARMSGNMVDVGSYKALKLKEAFYEYIQSKPHTLLNYRITGSIDLIDQTNDSLSINMLQGLAIAFAVIALLMGLLYKSFKIILISLIPNVIPLL